MFSPAIVESDAFLDMPVSSQALYFHLGMHADDDGFVNPKRIMREVGVAEDDLKVLVAKRFVLPFENGVVVIKHWRINNLIRKDWYKETMYLEEKKQLAVKENGSYTEAVNISLTTSLTGRQRRLGKVRLGKDTKSAPREDKSPKHNPLGAEVVKAFEGVDPKNKTYYENTTQRSACDFLIAEYGMERVLQAIKILPQINQQKLYVRQVTTPYELKENWVKIGNALKQDKNKKPSKSEPNFIL